MNNRRKEDRYSIADEIQLQRQIASVINNVNLQSVAQFNGSGPVICNHFGCINYLSLPEQLAGGKCTEHMNTKPININLIIKGT